MVKRVCLVSGIYPPDSGGPAKFIQSFSEWLGKKGVNSKLVVLSASNSATYSAGETQITHILRKKNLAIRYFLMINAIRRVTKDGTPILAAGAFLEVFIANMGRKNHVIFKIPGDIVWERARNNHVTTKTINEFQNEELSLKYKLFRKLYSSAIASADQVIVPSLGLYNLCKLWGADSKKLTLIHNSISREKFHSNLEVETKYDILTVCRLTEWKGVEEIIRASAQLGLSLAIVGDGPLRRHLEGISEELMGEVHFFGEVDSDQVAKIYNQARIFLLNSSYEGLPHVLLEARASELICIAKGGTGSDEVITHLIDGLLCGEKSGLTLIGALRLVDSTSIDINAMVIKAFNDTIERFDQETNFRKILELIPEVTNV
jgi:glycosyltransferase involved in cell wall biosynthesis